MLQTSLIKFKYLPINSICESVRCIKAAWFGCDSISFSTGSSYNDVFVVNWFATFWSIFSKLICNILITLQTWCACSSWLFHSRWGQSEKLVMWPVFSCNLSSVDTLSPFSIFSLLFVCFVFLQNICYSRKNIFLQWAKRHL